MSIQLTFDHLLPPVVSPGEGTLPERFAAFHAANPHVYTALRRLALQMRRAGVRRCGMKMLFEVLRWQYKLQTQGDEYRLNNVYTAFYNEAGAWVSCECAR